MIGGIKRLWRRISNVGVKKGMYLNDIETVFLNRFIACQTVLLIFYALTKAVLFGWLTAINVIAYVSLSTVTLFLNHYKHYTIARVYQVILMNVYVFISVLQYGGKVGNEYHFLIVSLFGLFFFWKRKIVLFGSIALSIILFFISIDYTASHSAWISLSDSEISDTRNAVDMMSFFVLWIMIYNIIAIWIDFQTSILRKNEMIEEKSDALNSGINYAKHIQHSLFPRIELVEDYFSNSFHYFRPKEKLSGDFPFFYKDEDEDTVWVAAADCTGHGIPGALISVLGINVLHRALTEKSIKSPEKVLDWASDEIEQSFNRFSNHNIQDGMDISIAKIKKDKDDFIVDWAGANNPLWIVPKDIDYLDCSSDAYSCVDHAGIKLIELRGNRRPVGRFVRSKHFTKQRIRLKKGDRMFMFSDGYTDQFGGDKNKKFSKKRFRYLLTSMQNESLSNFGDELYEFIASWSKGVEQVDDILVIGIEL